MKVSGIILSGGKSSRMQMNKAFLIIDRERIIEHIISVLRQILREIVIVTNEPELYAGLGGKVVSDVIPQQGPLSGVHAGLLAASHQHGFVVACDMPFVSVQLIQYLLGQTTAEDDVVVPRLGPYLQPLHAVYSKRCIPAIEECLHHDIHKLTAFYSRVRVKYIEEELIRQLADPDEVFFNVNTPADYELACQLVRRIENRGSHEK
ncbi:MAG: molybdenum cofactor guanylyltransferase [Firmicutes bacterium]|nr:molybdenum cofactor guanylyltransferase [Bacillota bacterium]